MEMARMKPVPVRMGSLVSASPQEQLLKLFNKNNLERFKQFLDSSPEVDLDFQYGNPDLGRLVDLCCMKKGYHPFLEELLKRGANPNKFHPVLKKPPLHIAIENENQKSLTLLLSCPKTNINEVDSRGNTALHVAASSDKSGQLVQLLLWRGADARVTNRKELMPIDMTEADSDNKIRKILQQALDSNSSTETNRKPQELFRLVRQAKTDDLRIMLSGTGGMELSNEEDGQSTALQWAAEHGAEDIVDVLLEAGANPSKVTSANIRPPLMLAARKGFHTIVAILARRTEGTPAGETALHSVVQGALEAPALGDFNAPRDHVRCLEHLLNLDSFQRIINQGDQKGNTPLHCAGKIGNEEMVFRILNAGAYIGKLNAFGDPAIAAISPITFEKYLDTCIGTNGKLPREDGYEIILNYQCFAPCEEEVTSAEPSERILSETQLLMYLTSSPDFRFLLRHPVVSSLVYMKWHSIRKWYFINLLFYVIFWALLTIYILSVYDTRLPSNHSNSTSEDISQHSDSAGHNLFRVFILITLCILAIREFFQMFSSCSQYFYNPENWLELLLIGVTFAVLFKDVDPGLKQQLAAIAILFSWTELVLLIGKHPALSTSIEMLKTVAWNFSKFLAWYSILIMAFALSFYTLFRDVDEEGNLFKHPGVSIFKTVVMLTGEFEAGEIPFVQYPVTSHLVFMLFVFAIAIVLYNLLNGLAVSDTQAIRADAELVGLASRVKLVSYVEAVDPSKAKLFLKWSSCGDKAGPYSWQRSLFMKLIDCELHIFPNEGNRIEIASTSIKANRRDNGSSECCFLAPYTCTEVAMDPSVVKATQVLLLNSRSAEKDDLLTKQQAKEIMAQLETIKLMIEDNRVALEKLSWTRNSIT